MLQRRTWSCARDSISQFSSLCSQHSLRRQLLTLFTYLLYSHDSWPSINTFSILSSQWLVRSPFHSAFKGRTDRVASQSPYGYSDNVSGLMGAALLLSGIVAAIASSPVFDRVLTHHLGITVRILCPVIGVAWLSLIWAGKPLYSSLYVLFQHTLFSQSTQRRHALYYFCHHWGLFHRTSTGCDRTWRRADEELRRKFRCLVVLVRT